jgi:hypothetical protein
VLGGVTLIAVVVLCGAALGAIAQPILYHRSVTNFGSWHINRAFRAWPLAPAGLVVLIAIAHLLGPLRAGLRRAVRLLDDRAPDSVTRRSVVSRSPAL